MKSLKRCNTQNQKVILKRRSRGLVSKREMSNGRPKSVHLLAPLQVSEESRKSAEDLLSQMKRNKKNKTLANGKITLNYECLRELPGRRDLGDEIVEGYFNLIQVNATTVGATIFPPSLY